MIDGLTIQPRYGEPLTFSLPAGNDGYLIKNIEGLGPVPVVLASSTQALMDGEVFQGSRREKRNIVLHIKLDQNYSASSIESRRNRLTALAAGGELEMVFSLQDRPNVDIYGYVEDVDTAIFTDDPMVIMSIVCMNPNFRSVERQEVLGGLTTSQSIVSQINYEGTVPTGIVVEFDIPNSLSAVVDLSLYATGYSNEPTGQVTIGPIHGEGTVHQWQINSNPGEKRFWETRREVSIMSYADFNNLVWPVLYPGPNNVSYQGTGSFGTRWDILTYWHDLYGAL